MEEKNIGYSIYYYYVTKEGLVYAVEFSHRSGRDLMNVAKKRTNIIPIIEDARHPHKYRMLMGTSCNLQLLLVKLYVTCTGMVDVVFADVAQPDQARIVSLNAQHFLKNQGHFVLSIKVSCIIVILCGSGGGWGSLLDKAILFLCNSVHGVAVL